MASSQDSYKIPPVLCQRAKSKCAEHMSVYASNFKVRNEFYKDTQGAMLVYDVSSRESFDALDSWLEEIKKDIGSSAQFEGVAFAVCANKVRKESSQLKVTVFQYFPRYSI